ncbi:MAG TPA: hypothetical protein VMB71_07340 [Acetobacteraceae bacterium]|nr:hypothetical protein [Acetobacteraceae bacterium]
MIARHAGRGTAQLFGIFIISLAVLAYQVLLTRLFSVVLYYHFAFAGVSLAMLGLTIGAERVYLHPDRFTPERLAEEWAGAAMRFAVSLTLVVLWFVYAPWLLPASLAFPVVSLSLIVFVIPFVYSGICVTLLLTRPVLPVGRMYAADLIGAATGCVGIVALLFLIDPISIFFALSALAAASAWLMAPRATPVASRAALLAAVFCGAAIVQGGLYLSGNDHLRLMWAKGNPQENILFERWNAISRIQVVPHDVHAYGDAKTEPGPFGWGFGHKQTEDIGQLYLDIDADAKTVLTRFDGRDLKPFSFLANDVVNAGYHVRPMQDVAVIGVGGGRDIMSALYFGARHVTGIELNPAIFEVLTRRYADFTGDFFRRPDVSLVNAEARSWINQSQRKFDLIQISLIDTWAATAAGGLTMSENKLYTVDAWKDFLARLQPHGMLEVARWFDPLHHRAEFYRLLSLAAESLRQRGVADADIASHVMAFTVNQIVTVDVSQDPFTSAEIARAHRAAAEQGFTIIAEPGRAWDSTSQVILSGRASDAFYDALPFNITAPTDNRPFFFFTWKPSRLFAAGGQGEVDIGARNDMATTVMGSLLVTTFLCVCLFVIGPLRKISRDAPVRRMLPHLLYFTGIGLGFMFIEISQMQRLMVFLGDPVYGLTVVLFTLLLFGGLGSVTVGHAMSASPWVRPALCCMVLCIVGLLTPGLTTALKSSGVTVRILASIALLAPAGFGMGMMFPSGMILSGRFASHQAWFWGVNGATSVFASVLGMAVSMEFGITQAYWIGVASYAACVVLVLLVTQSDRVASRAPIALSDAQGVAD